MRRYAITDRRLLPGDEGQRRTGLVAQAARLAHEGVEFLQVREKDLPPEELLRLAVAIRDAVAHAGGRTRVLLNGPAEIANAAGLELHEPSETRSMNKVVSVSCHSVEDVVRQRGRAELLLFGPVFEKRVLGEHLSDGSGLQKLAEACAAAGSVPVFALGGVTMANAPRCLRAGAAGIAGIRLFL